MIKRMLKRTIIFNIILVLFFPQGSSDSQMNFSKIHPALQVVLSKTSIEEKVDVYARLKDRYPFEELKQQIRLLSKKEKRKEIVKTLKDFATEKQRAVLTFLNEAEHQGKARNIEVLWPMNTVVFSATPDMIYSLANLFDEIKDIRYDRKFETKVADNITQYTPSQNEAINPGTTLINANDVLCFIMIYN